MLWLMVALPIVLWICGAALWLNWLRVTVPPPEETDDYL